MIEILKWKSFTLVTKVDDENDDDVQSITKKLTANANNLCVIIHDNDKEGMKLCFIFYIKYLSFSTIFFNNVYIYHKKIFINKIYNKF